MKRIIEQTSEYTIIELSLDQNGLIVDAQYIVRYKCTPEEDICSTLEDARKAAEKRLKKGGEIMSKILCLLSLLLLSACVTPPEIVYLPEFDQNMAKKQMEKGKNTIVGSSFLTTIGGDIKKCSGRIVTLIPATKYAEKRMNALYAQNEDGFYIPVSVKNGETKKIVVTRQ